MIPKRGFSNFLISALFFFLLSCVLFAASDDDLSVLIRKAELLLDQKVYAGGIAILETVLRKEPASAEAKTKLLEAYDEYSQKLAADGKFEEANKYLGKMSSLNQGEGIFAARGQSAADSGRLKREIARAKTFFLGPDTGSADELLRLNIGRERFNEAVGRYNKKEFELAEDLLLESVRYDQTNPFAYQLLGELANLRQDLKAAEGYYTKALALKSDESLITGYQKVKREAAVEKNQQHYSDERFIIRYRRGGPYAGSEIRELLRAAYRDISQEFGVYPKNKTPVILYDRDEYLTLMGDIPHWSAAAFDGKIRLPVYGGRASGQSMRKLIYHELTHAFVFYLSGSRCPVWLNEGLAEYGESKVEPISLAPLKDAAKKGKLIDMDILQVQEVTQLSSEQDVLTFYLQSYSITARLAAKYKMYKIKELLLEVGKGTAFNEAFEKTYLRTFRDFAGEWRKDFTGGK